MICAFGDDIHAKAWWYTIAFAMDKKREAFSSFSFLAPQTGLEPVTPRLTAACSTDWAIKANHRGIPQWKKCRRRPIFPGSYPPSIFGTIELNYRVRDGNGWDLNVIDTDLMCVEHIHYISKAFLLKSCGGDPYEIRTRVAGVRGRSLRPLDQRAKENGTPSGTRTLDTLIKSQVLYQLS